MRATRRYWAVAALAATLAALAVLLDRPLLLVGAVGLAAYLVAAGFAFHRALLRARDGLSVDQSTDRDRVVVEEPVTVSLEASFDRGASHAVEVEAGLPVASTGPDRADRTVTLERGGRSGRATFPLDAPVAGVLAFERPTVSAADPLGLLTETLELGPAPTLTVEPRGPRDVHVGEGGERVAAAFGEHPAGRLGPGLAPTELREYVHGDDASRIDWKATARLNHPYVREDEAETDRVTAILIDHRAAMGAGPPGETKLDYARQAALAVANAAREHDDPLGLYAVGDGGITVSRPPASTPRAYAAIRRALHDLAPTATGASAGAATDGTTSTTAATDGATSAASPARRVQGPSAARTRAGRLDGDASPFGTTLRPFLADAAAYVHRVDAEPLFRAARSSLGRIRGTLWTVLLTDDTDRAQVREAVKVARRGDDHVVVFLTPDALFEPGGLADVEAAYDRYRDFEAFRRELARMDRVSAFEVAPGDRMEAVLDAHRRRRAAGGRA